MSMIRCSSCGEIGDAKDAWLDGVYQDEPPFGFYCPDCADIDWSGPSEIIAAIKATDADRYEQIKFDACTCATPVVHSQMMEPPEPKSIRNRDCPIHGVDPDYERDKRMDR